MSREAQILAQLRDATPTRYSRQSIVQLLDSFTVFGPNGFHECLVTEVVVPIGNLQYSRDISIASVVR
jgi:hypothetical protein